MALAAVVALGSAAALRMTPIAPRLAVSPLAPPALMSLSSPAPSGKEDACVLPAHYEEVDETSGLISDSALESFRLKLTVLPIMLPLVAFVKGYDGVVLVYHSIVDITRTWYSVDGGTLEAVLLTPVINGVVQPAVSIVLGTLVAATLNSLRNRQLAIRAALNKEAVDIMALGALITSLCADDPQLITVCLNLLRQYTTRVIVENRAEGRAELFKSSETELDAVMRAVYASAQDPARADDRRMYDPQRFDFGNVVRTLNTNRAVRLAELQTSYPPSHWAILGLLSISVFVSFLIESDQAALQFVGSLQLRVLFAVLVGVAAAGVTLCIDLNDPYRGNFRITPSVMQLYTVREALEQQIKCAADAVDAEQRLGEGAGPEPGAGREQGPSGGSGSGARPAGSSGAAGEPYTI